jgi:hypothetical protein
MTGHGHHRRNTALALLLFLAGAIGLLMLAAPPAEGGRKLPVWNYKRIADRPESAPVRVSVGGGFVGRAKFVRNTIFISKRFRNAQGKKNKRLYAIRGALLVRLRDDYELIGANCKQEVGNNRTQIAPKSDGVDAFYPQQSEEAPETAGGVNVGLNLGPVSVSVPVPGLDLYSSDHAPAIGWTETGRDNKFKWGWLWNPFGDMPNDELLPFYGHWVSSSSGVRYSLKCRVVAQFDDDARGGATVRASYRVRTG